MDERPASLCHGSAAFRKEAVCARRGADACVFAGGGQAVRGDAQTGVQGKTNAWFVGFAPFDDPEIAIVVFVRNGGHGSYTAEVARDIIAQYFGMNTNQVTENTTAIPTVQIIN